MMDKVTQVTEQVANQISLSRRGFLGWVGRRGLILAGVLGGLFVTERVAQADPDLGACFVQGTSGRTNCLDNLTEEMCDFYGGEWLGPNTMCDNQQHGRSPELTTGR
jgi:hypothetical protein